MKITRHTNQDRDELVSGALSALKANPGRVEMIPDDTIETRIGSMNQSALENHAIEAQTGEQDEGSSPFLRLPAEIRTTIYHELIRWHRGQYETSELEEQPAITRVNRQLRAEVLPLFYDYTLIHLIQTKSSRDWVPYIQRMVDAFNGGADGQPGSSNLRLSYAIELDFTTPYGTHIEVELYTKPELMAPRAPDDPDKRGTVGGPGLDWTDAAAARAACDEAATLLSEGLRARPFTDDLDLVLVQTSDESDHKAALDCVRIMALACPHLTSVSICDSSRAHRVGASILRFMSYENLRERLFTDVEV